MRVVVVLSLAAVVSAGRLGYDYQPGVSGSAGEPIFLDSSRTGTVSSGSRIGAISNFGVSAGPSITGINFGLVYEGSDSSSRLDTAATDYELNKEFYHYSAPEEEFHDSDSSQRVASSLKRNLRVVFIKSPENNGLANAALQLAKQATEDKTAIYVLSKQPDISEFADQVQELRASVSHKPEVRFVKYRTPEDAINAQRSIQQQYDALRGSSRSSDEGIASVLNFASAAPQRAQSVAGGVDLGGSESALNLNPSGVIGVSSRREYLPPIVY